MTPSELLSFLRANKWAVQASVTPNGTPQAAVIGFVVTDDFELVFDTLDSTRKARNLRSNSAVAFVIGGLVDGERSTVQYEGRVDEPRGLELDRPRELHFARFPEGRARLAWPGLIHLRVRPTWIRFSDFSCEPPRTVEFDVGLLVRPA